MKCRHLIRKFKGHGMERLIAEILTARSYEVYQSPKGADSVLLAFRRVRFRGQKFLFKSKRKIQSWATS